MFNDTCLMASVELC